MMHLLARVFPYHYWLNQIPTLRDTLLEIGRVLLIYWIGKYLINIVALRTADTMIAGPQRLGLLQASAEQARVRTIIGLIRSVGIYVLFFVCGILMLRALNLDAVSVVTSASVAGIAVGLGAQKLFKDVISGFFIILEAQYDVGDYVTINNTVTGKIEEMGMRIVKVRDDAGRIIIMSNGDITQVCNQSRGAVTTTLDLGIPPGTDLTKVRDIISAAGKELFDQEGTALGLIKEPILLGTTGGDSTRTLIRAQLQTAHAVDLGGASQAIHDKLYSKLLEGGITPL